MTSIVITGAAGSIGSALQTWFPDAVGIDVQDWDIRRPYGSRIQWEDGTPDPLAPDIVFHLAASKDAPEGEVDPKTVMEVNAVGAQNVLARWPDAKVVLASTCKAAAPETAYGASKLIAERLVLNAGGSVARFHNVRETSGNVFRQWEALDEQSPIPVTPCWRYFIGVTEALYLLARVAEMEPGRYMIGPGRALWMPDVARATYPGREIVMIEPRRGDRLREPLHAPHETMSLTGVDYILKIRSPHD